MEFESICLRAMFELQNCPWAKVHLINSVSDKMVTYLLSLITAKLFPSILYIEIYLFHGGKLGDCKFCTESC